MKKENKIVLVSLTAIILSCIFINHEARKFTPIDKDETGIVGEYKPEDLNELAKVQYKKRQGKEILTDKELLKTGAKKVLKFEETEENLEARQILCDFLHCESNSYKEKDYQGIKGIRAEKFDYDDDGTDEIIGYWLAAYGSDGPCLNILKKQERGYKDISLTCNIDVKSPITMLNHKTNGCYDYVVYILPFRGRKRLIERRAIPINP